MNDLWKKRRRKGRFETTFLLDTLYIELETWKQTPIKTGGGGCNVNESFDAFIDALVY